MSDSYNRGYTGQPPSGEAPDADYNRGRNDKDAGLPHGGGPSAMSQAAYDEGFEIGKRFDINPNKELRRMLVQLAKYTAIGGILGFLVATVAGPNWFKSPQDLALQVGGIVFFITGAMMWGALLGILVGRMRTFNAFVLWLVLSGLLIWMVYAFVIQPFLRNIYG